MKNPLFTDVSPFNNGEVYQVGDWQRVPEIFHDETQVRGFFGDYRWLSNFAKAKIMLDGIQYDSSEKAYQAAKWLPGDREFFVGCTNRQAIAYNQHHGPTGYTTEQWDENKVEVMRFLLEQKFDININPIQSQRLYETQDRYLEETNWWNDTFWGRNLAGEGENNLGNLLMAIRETL